MDRIKKSWVILCLLVFALTGCNKQTITTAEVTTSTTSDSNIQLPDYDSFSIYNENGYFGDFKMSQKMVDKEPFYKLSYEDISILFNQDGSSGFTITKGKKSASFDWPCNIESQQGRSVIPMLGDLVGDGSQQLYIAMLDVYGTYAPLDDLHIINLDTLEEYKIKNYQKKLDSFLSTEIIEQKDKEVLLQVTTKDKKVYQQYVEFNEAALEENYKPYYYGGHISLQVGKPLRAVFSVEASDLEYSEDNVNAYGSVEGELVFNGTKFVLSKMKYIPDTYIPLDGTSVPSRNLLDIYGNDIYLTQKLAINQEDIAKILSSKEFDSFTFIIYKNIEDEVYTGCIKDDIYYQMEYVGLVGEEDMMQGASVEAVENVLGFDGLKAEIVTSENTKQHLYYTVDSKTSFPTLTVNFQDGDCIEEDLDQDGVKEIISETKVNPLSSKIITFNEQQLLCYDFSSCGLYYEKDGIFISNSNGKKYTFQNGILYDMPSANEEDVPKEVPK